MSLYRSTKELAVAVIILFIALSCNKKCELVSPDACDLSSLVVCDSSSHDLVKFVVRKDERFAYGMSNAIKSVPDAGEIRWIANNAIAKVNDNYYLSMANYSDTSWIGLESWAYLREVVLVKFDPFTIGKQRVFNESTYDEDSSVNYCRYDRWIDDYYDAKWQIDESQDNFILVTMVDYENETAEGEFLLHFDLSEQSKFPDINYADKIILRCGHFRSKIWK